MFNLLGSKVFRFLSLVVVALIIGSCAVNPVTGKKEVMFMSEEQEIALGKQSDPQIVAMYGLYQDNQLQKFINEKGQEMASVSHRPNLNYEFKILDSPVVNAFALPGGYVYFTRGILAHFNNEAEFAGVLGHEIGHVTARHSAKQQTKATIAQILFIGGLVVSPAFRNFANEAQQGMQLLFLKYSRDNESQSDELGVQYSTKIGYDAHQMADFFNTLNQMRVGTEAESLPTFLSTHPDPYDRYKKVSQLADKAQAKANPADFKVNRNSYLKMIDGIIYGDDPKQGYVENNMFYHPEMRFQFPIPSGWQTMNTPSQVQMAPSDGTAMMLLTLTQANTLQAAADSTLQKYGLTQVERKTLTLNGMQVLAMVSDQANQQTGQTIRILTYFISYRDLIFTFHGLAEKANFDGQVSNFNQTMRNFKVLTDQSKINKKPDRISVRTANKSSTLQSLLVAAKIPEDQFHEHAIINGMELDSQVSAGDLYKVIVK
ncbi:MAG: M48 family metalloprotease [Saprospiraceae bacterium]|nr:M48 family metalloprotease [Saprospiraceae bacterium]